MRRRRGDVVAGEADLTGVGRGVAGDEVEHRALAGAVRADYADRLALGYGEAELVGHGERAVPLRDRHELQQRGHAGVAATGRAGADLGAGPSGDRRIKM